MEINFLPKKIASISEGEKERENPFKGELIVKLLSGKEKIRAQKEMSIQINEEGQATASSSFDAAERLIDLVQKQVRKVDLIHQPSKTPIKTLEDLTYDQDGWHLTLQLGRALINGVRLGEV